MSAFKKRHAAQKRERGRDLWCGRCALADVLFAAVQIGGRTGAVSHIFVNVVHQPGILSGMWRDGIGIHCKCKPFCPAFALMADHFLLARNKMALYWKYLNVHVKALPLCDL